MQLEDYFNFLAPDDIRLKDTRIGIETILFDYLFRARTPEGIANIYPSLTLASDPSSPDEGFVAAEFLSKLRRGLANLATDGAPLYSHYCPRQIV